MNGVFLLNLRDAMLSREIEQLANQVIEGFSCPLNAEIEHFLKERAMDFARRNCSITYLAMNSRRQLLGYFTLAHKSLRIRADNFSKSSQRKLRNYAGEIDELGCFNVASFLVAQIGLNWAAARPSEIGGDGLLDLALEKLRVAQGIVGGGVVFLECEKHPKLLSFYQREPNCFRPFGERVSSRDGMCYQQLMRFL